MTIRSDDKGALKEFLSADLNPKMPHLILNYSYFPSKHKAREAAKLMVANDFQVEIRRGADKSNWLALARRVSIPTEDYIAEMRSFFEAIAEDLNGEYDGWEIEVPEN